MRKFSSLDLQQRTGEIQSAALREPVALTFHGRPRTVMLSVEEYCRLKDAVGELVPEELRVPAPEVLRSLPEDVLAYSTDDPVQAIVRMAKDDIAGVNQSVVKSEARRFARHFGRGRQ
jgi:PHD/YefM family antitoxin component YafN of YafNO toxin-antitoxin module